MKKKIGIVIVTLCTLCAVCATSFSSISEGGSRKKIDFKKVYNAIKDNEKKPTNVIVDEDNIVVDEDDVEYYKTCLSERMNGIYSQDDANVVINEILANKELNNMAYEAGIYIADEDYEEYKKHFEDLESDENVEGMDEIYELYEQFGGKDNYWKVMKEPLKERLNVRKYLDSLREEYFEGSTKSLDDIQMHEEWIVEEEKIKTKAIERAKKKLGKKKIKQLQNKVTE